MSTAFSFSRNAYMDVLSLLKEEDDNPRGRGGATEAASGPPGRPTLDEAAAVEAGKVR